MKTYMAKTGEIDRKWYVVDATKIPLGRLASAVANILSGKNKPIWTPHVDTGDHVIVLNTDNLVLTGNKLIEKKLYSHSGYIGNLKSTDYKTLMATKSDKALKVAVKGMLPKNSLGRSMLTRLHLFKGGEHNHEAQKPEKIVIEGRIE